MIYRYYRYLLASLVVASISRKVGGFDIYKILVPEYAKVGDTVHLTCEFDLGVDKLFTTKWFLNSIEFYRYLPSGDTKKTIFFHNISVDLSQSNETSVTIKNVTVNHSGKYACEVSLETQGFLTQTKSASMIVIDPPDYDPFVKGLAPSYIVGNVLNISCTSDGSSLPPEMFWKINNVKVNESLTVEYPEVKDSLNLTSKTIGLKFNVTPGFFVANIMEIKCISKILDIYNGTWTDTVSLLPNREYPRTVNGASTLEVRKTFNGDGDLVRSGVSRVLPKALIFLFCLKHAGPF